MQIKKKIKFFWTPLTYKNKLKLYYFNKIQNQNLLPFRHSISRHSIDLSTFYDVKKKTLKEIKYKNRLKEFFISINSSDIWFLIEPGSSYQFNLLDSSFIKNKLKELTGSRVNIITIDKIILNYLNSPVENNIIKKNIKSCSLQILPFSPIITNNIKKLLTFLHETPELLKKEIVQNSILSKSSGVFSSKNYLITFSEKLNETQIFSILFFFENNLKLNEYYYFNKGFFYKSFFLKKNFYKKISLNLNLCNDTLIKKFLFFENLDFFDQEELTLGKNSNFSFLKNFFKFQNKKFKKLQFFIILSVLAFNPFKLSKFISFYFMKISNF